MSYTHQHSQGGIGGRDLDSGESQRSGMAMHADYSEIQQETRSARVTRNDSDDNKKPTYLLEHLATFTVNKESGILYPADGMRRLLQLEKTTGIWSQKMQLCLDCHWVLIMDYETGNVIERFPASLIQEPTAFTSTDAMELYNNILVFIVSGGNEARSEMHIFQSQSVSAVHLVEGLKNLQRGNLEVSRFDESYQQQQQQYKNNSHEINNYNDTNNKSLHNHPFHATLSPPILKDGAHMYGMYDNNGGMDNEVIGGGRGNGGADSDHGVGLGSCVGGLSLNDETSSVSSDKYERDVNVLNHCFDDIEKFIARLQHAAAASRELERRRSNRKSKKKDPGEGLLMLRTRPPHEKEFIDIFAKFKLSFNLLAKLKSHIHDPNAPELVHFLFTPLALIVEAASDTYYDSQLAVRVVNPLLTREAINLLINCVTSKETELWRSLGDTWTVPRDQWKENVGSYHPVFIDGWSPDYLIVDELAPPQMHNIPPGHKHSYCHSIEEINNMTENSNNHNPQPHMGFANDVCGIYDDYDCQSDKYINEQVNDGCSRESGGAEGVHAIDYPLRSGITLETNSRDAGLSEQPHNINDVQTIIKSVQNLHTRQQSQPLITSGESQTCKLTNATLKKHNQRSCMDTVGMNTNSYHSPKVVEQWLNELQNSGAKVVLVTYPRTANNAKELSVMHGEYLEILDDTRKWWKARNIYGQLGHVPHTIVTPFQYNDNENRISSLYDRQHMKPRLNAGGGGSKETGKYKPV